MTHIRYLHMCLGKTLGQGSADDVVSGLGYDPAALSQPRLEECKDRDHNAAVASALIGALHEVIRVDA